MRNRLFLLAILIIALLQATLLNYIKVFGVKPDLLLIIFFISSLFFELKWALVFGICVGILKDILGINTFAINTLLLPLWSLLIMKLSKKISIDSNFIRAAFIFIIIISNDIVSRLIFLFLGKFIIPLSIFLRIAFLESLYTALVSFLIFRIFNHYFIYKRKRA